MLWAQEPRWGWERISGLHAQTHSRLGTKNAALTYLPTPPQPHLQVTPKGGVSGACCFQVLQPTWGDGGQGVELLLRVLTQSELLGSP